MAYERFILWNDFFCLSYAFYIDLISLNLSHKFFKAIIVLFDCFVFMAT